MPTGVYPHKRSDPTARFFAKVSILSSGCWEWGSTKIRNGYGVFWDGEQKVLAHRWSYERFVGPIPMGLELDHLCRNRGCVSPVHLEPVTRAENAIRGDAGLHMREKSKLITHCPKGHAYDEQNTWLRPNRSGGMSRHCRACQRLRLEAWREKNKDRLKQQRKEKYDESKRRRDHEPDHR